MKVIAAEAIKNKRVLVRLDLDMPMDDTGTVTDWTRLDAAIPTIELLKQNAKQVIFCGHMGRPSGKPDKHLSTYPIVGMLDPIVGNYVHFDDYIKGIPAAVGDGKFVLLENLRFWPGEEANDLNFAKQLANIADVFVFEAFGVAHRSQASTVGVTRLLPSFAGYHVAKEISELSAVLHQPIRPTVLIIGGAKIETKLPVIFNLEDVADAILVGGLLAKEAKEKQLKLPENAVSATLRGDDKDIDQASIDRFVTILSKAQSIIWNGTMGKYEEPSAASGTKQIAAAVVASEAYTIVGGGDTVAALHQANVLDQIDFISVGGGAMLAFLAGKPLPAIIALDEAK